MTGEMTRTEPKPGPEKERYGAPVPYISTRADPDFIFGERWVKPVTIYVQSGEDQGVHRVEGKLALKVRADSSGRYRIAKIFAGELHRSPLTGPGASTSQSGPRRPRDSVGSPKAPASLLWWQSVYD